MCFEQLFEHEYAYVIFLFQAEAPADCGGLSAFLSVELPFELLALEGMLDSVCDTHELHMCDLVPRAERISESLLSAGPTESSLRTLLPLKREIRGLKNTVQEYLCHVLKFNKVQSLDVK